MMTLTLSLFALFAEVKHVSSVPRTIEHQEILISTQQKPSIQISRRLILNLPEDVFPLALRPQTHPPRDVN